MTKREATIEEILNMKQSRFGHSTHVPILLCISQLYTIKTVVEIGSGPISTRLFLNREHFKDLQKIVSYETREGWYEKIKNLIGEDERLDYRLISKNTFEIDVTHSGDLLFLDGIKPHRKFGIENLSNNFDIIVLHDFKIKRDFKYMDIYKPPVGPITSIASNRIDIRGVRENCKWNRRLMENLCRL